MTLTIERLTFHVEPTIRDKFLAEDAAIWTPMLAAQPGFLRKETWLAEDPASIVMIMHWASREQWKAIAVAELIETDRRFTAAVGPGFELLDCSEFSVHAAIGASPVDSNLSPEGLSTKASANVISPPKSPNSGGL
jgi:uncharacterized protein (TIGR03792 family)